MSSSVVRPEVYRGPYARPFAVGALALAAFVLFDTLSHGQGREVRVVVGLVVFGLAVIYALAYRPAVALDADRVRLLNVLRDVAVPWPQVAAVRTRWSLLVETQDGRTFAAWAISAGSPARESRVGGLQGGLGGAAGVVPAPTHADTVRAAVLRRWEGWRSSGRPAATGPVELAWAWPSLAALVGGVVFLLLALAV